MKSLQSFIKISLASLLLISALSVNFAYAQDADLSKNKDSKIFSGTIDLKYNYNHLVNSKRDIPSNEGYFSGGANLNLKVNERFSVKSTLTAYNLNTTPANTPQSYTRMRSDRGFRSNTALIIEELKLYFEDQNLKLWGGKINPQFAWLPDSEKTGGVFSGDFTADYQLLEQIGAGGEVSLGDHKLTINSFFADNTKLNRSTIHRRKHIRSKDGSVANTSDFSSYTIVLNGNNILSQENLSYNLGYRSLGVEKMPGRSKEIGYTLGLAYMFELENGVVVSPLAEFVKINNFAGVSGANNTYSTIGAKASYNKVSGSLLSVFRNMKNRNIGLNLDDRQLQLSLGYQFTDNLSADISALKLTENKISDLLLGGIIKYSYKF